MTTPPSTGNGAAPADELLVVEQAGAGAGGAPFILDRHGRKLQGRDDQRRTAELRGGLMRHARVRSVSADAAQADVERILAALHEPRYLDALRRVDWDEPTMMPEWAPPGLPADSPLWAGVVATAFEGARTAISAAQRIAAGARFAYALCRPPGHHAGPAWLGGYCYLNTAAAAAYALCERGLGPVAIVDVDFHFPTGTSAIVAPLEQVRLGSVHASTLEEVPWRRVQPRERECFVGFDESPHPDVYMNALEDTLAEVAGDDARAFVLSLGYDTVASDPHGSWHFSPAIFARIGAALAAYGLPVCVVQEGGYSLEALAECSHAFATGLLDGAQAAQPESGLEPFRYRLDLLDEEIARLLGERFDVCHDVALYKRAHDIPMMQPERVVEVRERYLTRGADVNLPADFTAALFELMIGATCKLEDDLIAQATAAGDGGGEG